MGYLGSIDLDDRHRNRLVTKEFNDGVPPLEALKWLVVREQERRNAVVPLDDHNSSVMIHVDVHRAYFYAKPSLTRTWKYLKKIRRSTGCVVV